MEKLCQLRIKTDQTLSEDLRGTSDSETARELCAALDRFDAQLACVFDEFCGYCEEAEKRGIENYPLYHWTKSVIDDPKKQQKPHTSSHFWIGPRGWRPSIHPAKDHRENLGNRLGEQTSESLLLLPKSNDHQL